MKNLKKYTLISDDYEGHIDYVRHACRGIIINDGKILLVYQANDNKYLIPGGGVEIYENYSECVKREILEETGYEVMPLKEFLEIEELFYWDKNWQHIQHYFTCKIIINTNKVNLTESEKRAGCIIKWINIDEALNIFGNYEKYRKYDIATYGLYRREYLAIKAYLLGDIINITDKFQIERIEHNDIQKVLGLMNSNPEYFKYCPPKPSVGTIENDLIALPPNMTMNDKYYLGFYDSSELVGILDLIIGYPNKNSAFIGLFMIDKKFQNKHIGTNIINDITNYFTLNGYNEIRLGYAIGNDKAKSFWEANGFCPTGVVAHNVDYDVVVMKKLLK